MPSSSSQHSRLGELPSVLASLAFLADLSHYQSVKPYYFGGSLPPDREHERSNLVYTDVSVPIHNLRYAETQPTLEKNGFETIYHPSQIVFEAGSEKSSVLKYIIETTNFLKSRLAIELCMCYSYRVGVSF